jgi:hypothetical protein
MTADNFLLSLIHFQSHVGSTKQRPVLLLMDNHASPVDFCLIDYSKENRIVLLTFPLIVLMLCNHVMCRIFIPLKEL